MVMISNILDLRKFKIKLFQEDRYCLDLKLAEILRLYKVDPSRRFHDSPLGDILAEYVLRAEGEGLALWLSKTFVIEKGMTWDSVKRK